MKTLLFTLFSLLSFSLSLQADTSAEALFDAKCSSCHIKVRPQDTSSLIAPPIIGVMRHVNMTYPSQEEAVKFISAYVMHPQINKAVCQSQKIKRFGLMPSQKGKLSEEEVHSIAVWLVKNYASSSRKQTKTKRCNN